MVFDSKITTNINIRFGDFTGVPL